MVTQASAASTFLLGVSSVSQRNAIEGEFPLLLYFLYWAENLMLYLSLKFSLRLEEACQR